MEHKKETKEEEKMSDLFRISFFLYLGFTLAVFSWKCSSTESASLPFLVASVPHLSCCAPKIDKIPKCCFVLPWIVQGI